MKKSKEQIDRAWDQIDHFFHWAKTAVFRRQRGGAEAPLLSSAVCHLFCGYTLSAHTLSFHHRRATWKLLIHRAFCVVQKFTFQADAV